MKKIVLLIWVFFVGGLFLAGCASIINGTRQDVKINSNPSGAAYKIIMDGGEVVRNGFTPETVTLKRKKTYDVVMALRGYQETKIKINKKFNPMYLGNILIGGPLGLIIDAANGAMYKLDPNSVSIDFSTCGKA